jgi:hypothetical protein
MNRRTFLQSIAAFAILPSATTYKRVWRLNRSGLAVPFVLTVSDIPAPSDEMLRFYDYLTSVFCGSCWRSHARPNAREQFSRVADFSL